MFGITYNKQRREWLGGGFTSTWDGKRAGERCEAFCVVHQLEKFPIQVDLRACPSITVFLVLPKTL